MAENETLDLMGRNSGRWRELERLIARGTPMAEIRDTAVRCLCTTLKRIYEDVRVGDLLRASCGEDGDIDELARQARKHTDYVDIFRREADPGADRKTIARRVNGWIVDRFLDQIGMEMLMSQETVDVSSLRARFASIRRALAGPIEAVSDQLARNPDKPPRRPAVSKDAAERKRRELLTISLVGR